MTLFKIILPLITLVLVALPTIRVSAHSDKPHSNKQNENTASLNRQLEYEPPAPGSYRLPPIQQAVDGDVIDADGREHHLFELMADKYVILPQDQSTLSARGKHAIRLVYSHGAQIIDHYADIAFSAIECKSWQIVIF